MEELRNQLIELENQIQNQEVLNLEVSKSAVGWHIEHTLLVINLTIASIQKSNPENYKWAFNLNRTLVFMLNKIPRGKVKAPKSVQPNEFFADNLLQERLQISKKKVETLSTLNPNAYFEHPFMGDLNLKSTVRFLKLHTKHHINIIKEIIES